MTPSPDPADLIAIATTGLTAQVNPFGAELAFLALADGSPLLWDGDPEIWAGRAPILFPIVGALEQGRYRLGDAVFAMQRHGFARRRLFTLAARSSTSATLRLEADAETLAQYPFHFRLDIRFTLAGFKLTMEAAISNLGDAPMPASFGFHPALRWPLPGGMARHNHEIHFASDEPDAVRRLTADGTLSAAAITTPVRGKVLALNDTLFENDALIFDQIASRHLTYGAPGGERLEIDYDGFPYLGLWTKPGAGYLCIEPWHGLADPAGYDGDFRDKPGVFSLAPGETRNFTMTIAVGAS